MHYHIEPDKPLTHLLNITLSLETNGESYIVLKLPFWRPGRYEAANYSKNIQKIDFLNERGELLKYVKSDSSTWKVKCDGKILVAKYTYFAYRMDAGNSWYGEDQIYINFINCMLFNENRIMSPCEVSIKLPGNYEIACGLKNNNNCLHASSYYELADSPLIASNTLQRISFLSHNVPFEICIQGDHKIDVQKLIKDFKKFTDYQIELMGQFPEKNYFFLNQFTDYKHYHGVEHANSTVICIGPSADLTKQELYSELLGVSSHELFHAWNIIKIRPKELMPYDFGKPPVFSTGFVAEGFTTYYGDLFLVKSGVFNSGWYFHELNKLLKRHYHNLGRLNNSVINSSIDLWVDGYQPSAPHKKSSIYAEGAINALSLDLLIRNNTKDNKSLDDVIVTLWEEFGKTGIGYSVQDIVTICETAAGIDLANYFEDYVFGTNDSYQLLNSLLSHVGCKIGLEENKSILEGGLGIKYIIQENIAHIAQTYPDSKAENYLSVGDKIKTINGTKVTNDLLAELSYGKLFFEIEREHKLKTLEVEITANRYYPIPEIQKLANVSQNQEASFQKWLNVSFRD